jgi:hypothetical protein
MKTNSIQSTPSLANQIASHIINLVAQKGTVFVGFDYNGTRRNVTLGADFIGGGYSKGEERKWGRSFNRGEIVEYMGKLYIQGVPNNEKGPRQIKTFSLDKMENVKIG